MIDSGNNNYATNSNTHMSSYLHNNVPVHLKIVVLASYIMPNPQYIKVLDTVVEDFSTNTVDVNDNSNQIEISNKALIIGMTNIKRIRTMGY